MMAVILFDNIPDELLTGTQAVGWCYENNTKVPYNVLTGRKAKSNDPTTWTTVARAREAIERGHTNDGRTYDGIGRMFAKGGGEVGVDLDNCIDEDDNIKLRAQEI